MFTYHYTQTDTTDPWSTQGFHHWFDFESIRSLTLFGWCQQSTSPKIAAFK